MRRNIDETAQCTARAHRLKFLPTDDNKHNSLYNRRIRNIQETERNTYELETAMTFNNDKPIYLQIVDLVCTSILSGEYRASERIPALRELSAQLEVNINTVIRSLDYLQQNEIIYNKRGLGFFVSDSAVESIKAIRRKTFMETTLPKFIEEMKVLGISWQEVMALTEAKTMDNGLWQQKQNLQNAFSSIP